MPQMAGMGVFWVSLPLSHGLNISNQRILLENKKKKNAFV